MNHICCYFGPFRAVFTYFFNSPPPLRNHGQGDEEGGSRGARHEEGHEEGQEGRGPRRAQGQEVNSFFHDMLNSSSSTHLAGD